MTRSTSTCGDTTSKGIGLQSLRRTPIHPEIAFTQSTVRDDSEPPPSYSASSDYHLPPEDLPRNETVASSNSHLGISDPPNHRPFTSGPSDLFDSHTSERNRRASVSYRPITSLSGPNENLPSSSITPHFSQSGSSHLGMKTSTSCSPSSAMTSASARPIPTMISTSDEKNNETVKQLISNNPDLRNSIYSFLGSTIVALEGQRPEDLKAKDVKIDSLQKQLLEALNYGNEKARKIEKLESDLKLANETGLSQTNAIEDLRKKLQKQEGVEKNIRKGSLALQRELDPLKPENARLKSQLKDAEKEIRNLTERVDYQNHRLEIYSQKTRNTELKASQMETVLEKLVRENHSLVLKGEQMSGRLLAVAEQWHEPNPARRKRQMSEMLDDGERAKRFSRMSR